MPVIGAENAPNLVNYLAGRNVVVKPAPKNPVRIEAYEFQNLSGAGSLMQVKENGGLILNDPDPNFAKTAEFIYQDTQAFYAKKKKKSQRP